VRRNAYEKKEKRKEKKKKVTRKIPHLYHATTLKMFPDVQKGYFVALHLDYFLDGTCIIVRTFSNRKRNGKLED
jgi:hypothetical protein